MKKRMRRACALLLSVVMTLGGPVGNGWAEMEAMEQELADVIYEAEELSVASASDAQRDIESNEELEDEEEFDDSVLEEDGEKEYDKNFSELISDLELLHADDLTEITEDEPIAFGEDAVIRFYYKLDEVMRNVLEDGERVELEYQLSDELLKLTNSYGEMSGENLDSGDDGNLDWQVIYGDGGLLGISIEAEQDAVLDEKGYVDIWLTVDGEEITESLWEILVECSEGELRKELFVSAGEEIALTSVEGDFEIDKNGVLVKYLGDGGDVVIPDGVTEIGEEAFSECLSLNSVEIPDSVTRIGKKAFYDCDNLNSVEIPDSVVAVGDYAFYSCYSLKSVKLSKKMTKINYAMFMYCTKLKNVEIPDSIVDMEKFAFYECQELETIKLPAGMTKINMSVFNFCKNLNNVEIPYGVVSIDACAFQGCNKLDHIVIPDSVTSIGVSALGGCALTNIKLPPYIEEISDELFFGCDKLSQVEIPDGVISIGLGAFTYCSNLQNVTLPPNLQTIDHYAFYSCNKLESITIPDKVVRIGGEAFADCSNLSKVVIPKSVLYIEGINTGPNRPAFCYSPNITIYGYSGSLAEAYAKEYEVPFVALDGIGKQTGFLARFLTWDPATQEATFDISIPYHATDDTDMSFLDSLDTILGSYVWVEDHPTNVGQFLSITPLEERFGTITAANSGFVNIDGESYMMRSGLADLVDMMKELYLNQYVKYYIAEDIIYDIKVPEQKTGILKAWNASSSEITIADSSTGSETVYPVSLTDLSVIASLDVWMGHEIGYSVLDGVIYRIITKAYETQTLGKVKDYDASAGLAAFENGAVYGVSSDAESAAVSFVGRWAVCTLTTSVDGATEITAFAPVEAQLTAGLVLEHATLTCKNGKYSVDGKNYQKADAIEIPFVVDVRNTLNISDEEFQMYQAELREDENLSLTTEAFTMELPDGFSVEWLDGRTFEAGKVLLPGDTWVMGGALKIRSDYMPEAVSQQVTFRAVMTANGKEANSSQKMLVTRSDSDEWLKETKQSLQEVVETTEEVSFISQDIGTLLTKEQAKMLNCALAQWVATVLDEDISDRTKRLLYDSYQYDMASDTLESTYIVTVEVNNLKYPNKGERRFEFHLNYKDYSYILNQDPLKVDWEANLTTITWRILDAQGLGMAGAELTHILKINADAGIPTMVKAMKKAMTKAKEGIDKGLEEDLGFSLNVFDEMLDEMAGNPEDYIRLYAINITKEWVRASFWEEDPDYKGTIKSTTKTIIKKVVSKCPVDVYVYHDDVLIGAVENNQADSRLEQDLMGPYIVAEGDIKTAYLPDDSYSVKLIGNDKGTMDYIIYEYGNGFDAEPSRTVYFDNLPLEKGKVYAGNIGEGINLEKAAYVLTTDGTVVEADYDTALGDIIVDKPAPDEPDPVEPDEPDEPGKSDETDKPDEPVSPTPDLPSVPDTPGDNTPPSDDPAVPDDSSSSSGTYDGSSHSGGESGGGGSSASHSASAVKAVIPSTPGYWMQDEKGWRFMNPDGTAYLDTWVYVNNRWYRLGTDGYMLERWVLVNDVWYYLTPESGEMKTGWLFDGQSWYYLDESGAMKTGWIFTNGGWYYLGADGRLLLNTVTPDGYQVDGSGKWIN